MAAWLALKLSRGSVMKLQRTRKMWDSTPPVSHALIQQRGVAVLSWRPAESRKPHRRFESLFGILMPPCASESRCPLQAPC